jgi:hypothetical protein
MVVVGGPLVSQFITLFITPGIYLYLEEFQEKVLDKTSFFKASQGWAHAEAGETAGHPADKNPDVPRYDS